MYDIYVYMFSCKYIFYNYYYLLTYLKDLVVLDRGQQVYFSRWRSKGTFIVYSALVVEGTGMSRAK